MEHSSLLDVLISSFVRLPGVGQKTAQRLAHHLLQRDRAAGRTLADSLRAAMDGIGHCARCNSFSENKICEICEDPRRDRELLCIVETPVDQQAIEAAGYRGLYFVLMGHLSPLDGIGPEELGIDLLAQRLQEEKFAEVILATNMTTEGEATAHYLCQIAEARGVKASRIAYGLPSGGELEYADRHTILHSLEGRRFIEKHPSDAA